MQRCECLMKLKQLQSCAFASLPNASPTFQVSIFFFLNSGPIIFNGLCPFILEIHEFNVQPDNHKTWCQTVRHIISACLWVSTWYPQIHFLFSLNIPLKVKTLTKSLLITLWLCWNHKQNKPKWDGSWGTKSDSEKESKLPDYLVRNKVLMWKWQRRQRNKCRQFTVLCLSTQAPSFKSESGRKHKNPGQRKAEREAADCKLAGPRH